MKEYRVSGALRKTQSLFAYFLIGFGILLTIAPFTLLLFKSPKTELWEMLLIPILVISGLSQMMFPTFILWQLRKTRVVVSPDGIAFSSPGFDLQSTWDNIERIRELGRYDSLILRKPGGQKRAWWSRLLNRQAEREIPLSMFPGWRNTELGQEIKKYTSHLFDG
jgi:hypothetical protein